MYKIIKTKHHAHRFILKTGNTKKNTQKNNQHIPINTYTVAKRFCDTELNDKEWFMSLSCRLKCAVRYLFDKCDNAGVWNPNYSLASVYVGESFTEREILEIDDGNQFEKTGKKIFVKKFISFQYGELTENCKPHRPIIQKLKKYGLYERVLKGYQYPINRVQEKEQDKEKEKEKDFGKSENLLKTDFPQKEEVQRVFHQQGGTEEMATAFFNRYEAVNWKIRGSPVLNFSSLVGTFIINWKTNEKNANNNTGTSKNNRQSGVMSVFADAAKISESNK